MLVLNPPAGKDIDEADCVFRVKPHPTVGYEKYVGTKTDFTAMYMAMADNMVGHTPPRLGYLWHTLRRFQLDDFLRLYASGKTRGLQHGTADLLVSPRSIDGALALLAIHGNRGVDGIPPQPNGLFVRQQRFNHHCTW